jgi:hypothetical protein
VAVSDAQKQHFFALVAQGVSVAEASRQAGFSDRTGWRLTRGYTSGSDHAARNRAEELPAPRSWEELSPEAQEALRNFNFFSRRYLARRPSAWRLQAAEALVQALLDKTDRTFIVMNTFPGAGKSTLIQDAATWIQCGGGSLDPAFGRAQRIMFGHASMTPATQYVSNLRRILELRRPFYDKDQALEAEGVLALDFGRFKPNAREGEESLWTRERFLVAQMGDRDVYAQEPTVQAASRESGFLGNRVDLGLWDDLANSRNASNPEIAEALDQWFVNEAESRIEPGGVLALVGQRLSAIDVYRHRLDAEWLDEDGTSRPRYEQITFPAHRDELCLGEKHEPWDGGTTGCITDAARLNWRGILQAQSNPNYRTLYQQEDVDPGRVLVLPVWLEGGRDYLGFDAVGCYDAERDWGEWPTGVGTLVSVLCVDPSVSGWWAIELWGVQPEPPQYRYLVEGHRVKLRAGDFLDFDPEARLFVGLLEDVFQRTRAADHPLQVLVVEQNAAHKYLQQTEAFRRWKDSRHVAFLPHTTGINKISEDFGIAALVPMSYRSGLKRLPRKPGGSPHGLNYLKNKVKELTTFPHSQTDDLVLSDWFLEHGLQRGTILRAARNAEAKRLDLGDTRIPPYLEKTKRTVSMAGTDLLPAGHPALDRPSFTPSLERQRS